VVVVEVEVAAIVLAVFCGSRRAVLVVVVVVVVVGRVVGAGVV